jgi:hypothetical protein
LDTFDFEFSSFTEALKRALDRAIADLTMRHLCSWAHEVAQQELMTISPPLRTFTCVVLDDLINSLWPRYEDKPWSTEAPATSAVVADDCSGKVLAVPSGQDHVLQIWDLRTGTIEDLLAPTRATGGGASDLGLVVALAALDNGLTPPEPPRITVRISVGSGPLIAEIRVTLPRSLKLPRALMRLFDCTHDTARLLPLIIHSGRRHPPNALAFVSIILMACWRFGHCSEADDHAFLRDRRYPVIRGSCPQT